MMVAGGAEERFDPSVGSWAGQRGRHNGKSIVDRGTVHGHFPDVERKSGSGQRQRFGACISSGKRQAKNEPPSAQPSIDKSKGQGGLEATDDEKRDVKQQYLLKAKRREEIIALLRTQREERILKESFSNLHKSKTRIQQSKAPILESDLEDKDIVKALN